MIWLGETIHFCHCFFLPGASAWEELCHFGGRLQCLWTRIWQGRVRIIAHKASTASNVVSDEWILGWILSTNRIWVHPHLRQFRHNKTLGERFGQYSLQNSIVSVWAFWCFCRILMLLVISHWCLLLKERVPLAAQPMRTWVVGIPWNQALDAGSEYLTMTKIFCELGLVEVLGATHATLRAPSEALRLFKF